MKNDFIFCLFSPILLNGVVDDMICCINTDSIFTLDYVNAEEIYFFSFMEGIIQDSIKFLH